MKRNDIVVFNFPAGDTVALKVQNPDYYHLVEQYGREAILLNKTDFGDVIYRPVDKRENYVKRCIGMPGDTIEIRGNQVYIDGVAAKILKNATQLFCRDGRFDAERRTVPLAGCQQSRSCIHRRKL